MTRPYKFIAVGESFTWLGKSFKCVRRPAIDHPTEVCKGCDLGHQCDCAPFQCSRFDRSDNTNVWFKTK